MKDRAREAYQQEFNKLNKNITAEEMDRKKILEFDSNREKWIKEEGLSAELETFIYFPFNSYNVKEELKAAGFRFSKILLWHAPIIPEGYEDKVVKVSFSEDNLGELNAWGKGNYFATASEIIKTKVESKRPVAEVKNYEWVGTEKERLYDIPVTLVSIREIETKYGWVQLVKMESKDEKHLFTWWTTVEINFKAGDSFLLTGTIKKLDEYKGEKSVCLSRCILKAE